MTTKTVTFRVAEYTPGTVKCKEIDAAGEPTVELVGTLYLRKSAVGALPVGSLVTATVTFG